MSNFEILNYDKLFAGLIDRIEEPSDGYDPMPRPIVPELESNRPSIGHIAFMGDFDRSK